MKKAMSALKNIFQKEYISLCILLSISALLHFPFVLKGLGDTDASGLAVSIIDFITHGKKGFLTTLYFLDVVPLYVIYIKFTMKLLNYNYSYLPIVMNYTNAVFGTIIVIPAYLLIKRLFDNSSIAFYSVLTFTFAPSIFQSSVYGFPSLLGLFFFIASLYFFLKWMDDTGYIWLILSFITLTSTMLLKSDFILGCGAYFGLLFMRKIKEKEKIFSSLLIVGLSIGFFLLLRQWMIGASKGSTTSLTNFVEWFKHFLNPLLSKGFSDIFENQVSPIISGMGILNFIMAFAGFIYYLIKRKFDILGLVVSWTALPTILWLLLWNNNARHNMLSVLPFIMIIFLFLHDKAPKFMAFSTIILIAGNFLVTSPSASIRVPSGNLFKSQSILNSQVKSLHLVAKKIAELDDDNIVFINESFRPYVYFELINLAPQYELIKIEDSCYKIKNMHKECVICTNTTIDPMIYIKYMITKHNLEEYTIVSPMLNLKGFKEEGFKIVDIEDIETWLDYEGPIPTLYIPSRYNRSES